jgi:hypothetical protein
MRVERVEVSRAPQKTLIGTILSTWKLRGSFSHSLGLPTAIGARESRIWTKATKSLLRGVSQALHPEARSSGMGHDLAHESGLTTLMLTLIKI